MSKPGRRQIDYDEWQVGETNFAKWQERMERFGEPTEADLKAKQECEEILDATPEPTPGALRDIAAILRESNADGHAALCERWATNLERATP